MDPKNERAIASNIGLIKPRYKLEDEGVIDPLVKFAMERVADEVVIYCNLDNRFDIDPLLYSTIALMAVDYIDSSSAGVSDDEMEADSIKSITEGDVTVTRETYAQRMRTIATTPSVLKDYRGTLNKFRRLKR